MGNPAIPAQWNQFQTAAAKLGIEPQLLDILKPEDIAPAFDAATRQHADAIIVQIDALTQQNRTLIVDLGSQSSTAGNPWHTAAGLGDEQACDRFCPFLMEQETKKTNLVQGFVLVAKTPNPTSHTSHLAMQYSHVVRRYANSHLLACCR